MLLDVKNIDVLYDDFQVIWDVSINVNKAEMVALLGPNGSGKSTILNTISNLVHHKNGSIHFENDLISEIPTYKRTELGISHVLERRRVFPHLTVMQNLLLGAWHPKAKEKLAISLSKIYETLNIINDLIWSGAFTYLPSENIIIYKYGLLLNHDNDLTDFQIDQILSDALTNCEGFYPSLQKVVWGGASPSEAIGIAMMPTQGEA